MKPLGETQRSVLRALAEHGQWHVMCGWMWDTTSGTIRVLESLVRRGLVTKTTEKKSWSNSRIDRDVYRVR